MRLPDAGLRSRSYYQEFAGAVDRFPTRVAFRLKTPAGYTEVSYEEVRRQSRGVAWGLHDLGLRAGQRVAILSENRPEWVIAYLGILLAGGVVVPLDAQISPEEWIRLLEDSESQRLFVSRNLLEKLGDSIRGATWGERLILFDEDSSGSEAGPSFRELSTSDELRESLEFPSRNQEDLAAIIYTSGTTGNPKGVMLTHGNLLGEIAAVRATIQVDERDSLLCLLPLQHVLASVINALVPLTLGACVNFIDTLKRSEIIQALEDAGATILATVPQFFYLFHGRIQEEIDAKHAAVRLLFRCLLQVNRGSRRWLRLNLGKILFARVHRTFGSRLRLFVSGGSSLEARVAQDFHDLGFVILQGYGLTETTGGCTVTPVGNNVLGSVGPELPGQEVRIVNPGEDGVGEIAIKGPIVMKGYYRDPVSTAAVLRDGWFYSGDLGRLDGDGNLFITGRRKEVIVLPNGKNIYPDELETHYLESPYIQEIAVLGVRADKGFETSERLHAVIVPNFDFLRAKKIANAREILRDEVARWSNRLPKYKRLTSYHIQKEPLPRTSTRKVKRLELKQTIEAGELAPAEVSPKRESPEDLALRDSSVGRVVLHCLTVQYQRNDLADLGDNLELDLGFDSMERVELIASLEQLLGVGLPDETGVEIQSVRDLIKELSRISDGSGGRHTARKSWSEILAPESRSPAEEPLFSGRTLTFLKYFVMRLAYVLFRIFLRLEVRGLRNLPRRGAFLLCPNHLSYMDPLVVMSALPYQTFHRVFFVGYSEYFKSLLMKAVARLSNIVPVDPDAHLLRAMRIGAGGLHDGRVLCIFPEGARSFDGELLEFKKGASILAHEVGVPIVPVAIHGTHQVWPRDSMRIRLHKVKLTFGPLIAETVPGSAAVSKKAEDSYQSTTDLLRESVAEML